MGRQLLIVDDEENTRHMLCSFLEKHNYATETALNGEDALEKLRDSPYDAVLCDVRMPEMDGMNFLKRIKCLYNEPERLKDSFHSHSLLQNSLQVMKENMLSLKTVFPALKA